jgi:phosphoglycolate phosphatase-like HAD superfamily hydrolase
MVFRVMELTGVGDPGAVAVVGDTLSDLESGERAGAGWIIGVRSGAHTGEQLAARRPSVILDSVVDLPAYFTGEYPGE